MSSSPKKDEQARYGWESAFPEFRDAAPRVIRDALKSFIADASKEQVRAWDDSIPLIQTEVREICEADERAPKYTAILEYELPLESRRPDVILLVRGAVVVLELKGKLAPSQADLDQAAGYARDLRCYHRACDGRPVHAVVVPTRAEGYEGVRDGVHVAGPDALDELVQRLQPDWAAGSLTTAEFLSETAYRPLPTLVRVARELFESRTIRKVWRAAAVTDPAVAEIGRLVHEAARSRQRKLILVTGVPGAGKTLVGLRVVHADYLDDLAIARAEGKPTTPGVFLSGNGPLVQVLQYELRNSGGEGKTFVRGVKEYVKKYSGRRHLIPPEHVLIFDEAQRAWDKDAVAEHHDQPGAKSEPEHFIEFAERIPEWCVVIGLIGTGQEIHKGEEGGLVQWRRAIEGCAKPGGWTVHGAPQALEAFRGSSVSAVASTTLSLDVEIRFHLAKDLHGFVERLLESGEVAVSARPIAEGLIASSYRLHVTRDLEAAKRYLRDRYREAPEARFGIVASSKDKQLEDFGILNAFQDTKRLKVGPWFSEGEVHPLSCRHLKDTVTEFQAQGLELDAVLLAWGTDLIRKEGRWSNALARGYQRGARVKDPFQLRVNAYRVLLTRGRDGTVVFVPPIKELDETFQHLCACGFRVLEADEGPQESTRRPAP
jgi:hypothetical protein